MDSSHALKREKYFVLTKRELEIVGTVVAGYTNQEIAQKFSLSVQTVENRLSNIFDKLGVSDRLELALFAVYHHQVEGGFGERYSGLPKKSRLRWILTRRIRTSASPQ